MGALAAACWIVWLVSLAQAGCLGAPPHAGCPRLDFAAFWGAGRLADAGVAGDAYRWPRLAAELQGTLGKFEGAPLPFLYPPPMLLAAAALGTAPYRLAFLAWTATGLTAYAAAAWTVLRRPSALLVAFAPAAAFYCLFSGQNGFLTAAALAFGLALLDRRPRLAGVCLALFACKPQLALLAPLALVAGARWRALLAMAATYAALCAAAAAAFGPSVLTAFVDGTLHGGGVFAGGGWLPWWKVQSLYGALRGTGVAPPVALAAQAALALAVAGGIWRVWSGRARADLRAAALAAGALLASPYAFVYDGLLLAVAALFLLRDGASGAPLTRLDAAGLTFGLVGQALFVLAPSSLATPVAAAALFALALLRAERGLGAGLTGSPTMPPAPSRVAA